MSAEDYSNACEQVVGTQVLQEFEDGVKKIKSTIRSFGFSQKAVDNLQFSLREFSLNLGEGGRRNDGYNFYADEKPFYEMAVSAPGSVFQMSTKSVLPIKLDDKNQSLLLFFELSTSLVDQAHRAVEAQCGYQGHGGNNTPFVEAHFDTAFRWSPKVFLQALDKAVEGKMAALVPPRPKRIAMKPNGQSLTP